jgi:hypothetical protein
MISSCYSTRSFPVIIHNSFLSPRSLPVILHNLFLLPSTILLVSTISSCYSTPSLPDILRNLSYKYPHNLCLFYTIFYRYPPSQPLSVIGHSLFLLFYYLYLLSSTISPNTEYCKISQISCNMLQLGVTELFSALSFFHGNSGISVNSTLHLSCYIW